jgi:gamma-glutamylcyclotransferase (GGCT)/AIG2-like uncharacterized protein YtfP
MTERLFSYGTLQDGNVQLATFQRLLEGHRDSILGYKVSQIEITDEEVIASSGLTHHPILLFTGNETDTVDGTVFNITAADLAAADEYEASDYKRVTVPLQSSGTAWVYVSANE